MRLGGWAAANDTAVIPAMAEERGWRCIVSPRSQSCCQSHFQTQAVQPGHDMAQNGSCFLLCPSVSLHVLRWGLGKAMETELFLLFF